MARYLFLAFTVVPLVELYLLIHIGRHVGAFSTIVLLLATGLVGAWLARQEGLRVIRSWQAAMAQGRLPADGILSGALVLVGGVLLITPGVLTDVVGLLLLVPPTRRWAAVRLRRVLERKLRDGTLKVETYSTHDWDEPDELHTPATPLPRASPPARRAQGEVDAEFTEEPPRR